MNEILITGGVGLVSTIVSSCISWVLARKKYNSEVDHNTIENMDDSLNFYTKLSDDNRARLEELTERNRVLEAEIQELRKQVLDLTFNICLDLSCAHRIREQVKRKRVPKKNIERLDETINKETN